MRLWIMSDLHAELTRGWDLPAADQTSVCPAWNAV